MVATELSSAAAAGVLAGWGGLMQLSYWSEQRRRRRATQTFVSRHVVKQETVAASARQPDRSVLAQPRRTLDHPLACWLAENSAVAIISLPRFVASFIGAALPLRQKFAISWLGTIASERTQCAAHFLLTHIVYGHIPYFHPSAGPHHMSNKGPAEESIWTLHGGVRRVITEWLEVSVLSQMFVTLLQVFLLGRPAQPGAAVPSVPAALRAVRSSLASIHPLAFCAKLAIVRTVVDIFFALGHWVIHRYVPHAALPDLLYRSLARYSNA